MSYGIKNQDGTTKPKTLSQVRLVFLKYLVLKKRILSNRLIEDWLISNTGMIILAMRSHIIRKRVGINEQVSIKSYWINKTMEIY